MQKPAKAVPASALSEFPDFFNPSEAAHNIDSRQIDPSGMSVVSVSEAAKLLGITERSVWRRIRQKKLKSKLKNGRTFVSIRQSDIQQRQTDASVTTSIEPQDVMDEKQLDTSGGALEMLTRQAEKLEGASYRIGFLEAQAEVFREQVKLIPDLQARASELEQMKFEVARLTKELELRNRTPWDRLVSWLKGSSAGT